MKLKTNKIIIHSILIYIEYTLKTNHANNLDTFQK